MPIDRDSTIPDTVPGATVRGLVRSSLDDMLDELIPEVQQTTAALQRHRSDYPEPDAQPETARSGPH